MHPKRDFMVITASKKINGGEQPFGGPLFLGDFINYVQPNHQKQIKDLNPGESTKAKLSFASNDKSIPVEIHKLS